MRFEPGDHVRYTAEFRERAIPVRARFGVYQLSNLMGAAYAIVIYVQKQRRVKIRWKHNGDEETVPAEHLEHVSVVDRLAELA